VTADQHRAIAAILGYPTCCVEQWIAEAGSSPGPAIERGSITLRRRSEDECVRLSARIRVEAYAGWQDRSLTGDSRVCYVPCSRCAAEAREKLRCVTTFTHDTSYPYYHVPTAVELSIPTTGGSE
jgi:hypothetical protein